jgi:hypothetical protein
MHLTRPVDLEMQDIELMESLPGPSGVSYHPVKQ